MDLLLFAEEDETLNHLLISEDSNKSWNGKVDRDEMGENTVSSIGPISSENEPLQLLKNANGNLERNKQGDYDPKIEEARKKRERARRFSSFTSCIPDLEKLWAPKQKAVKLKSDSLRKLPTRKKKRERASCDKVCETPLTGNKRSCLWTSKVDDDHYRVDGSQTNTSVSKALFQDDQLM